MSKMYAFEMRNKAAEPLCVIVTRPVRKVHGQR